MSRHPKHIIERARELRRDMSPAERKLWYALRNRQLAGHRFRRQHPIGSYVADFICLAQKLIVEVDGDHHGLPGQITYDLRRTTWLESKGFHVHRICASDVLQSLDDVLIQLGLVLAEPPSPQGCGDGETAGAG